MLPFLLLLLLLLRLQSPHLSAPVWYYGVFFVSFRNAIFPPFTQASPPPPPRDAWVRGYPPFSSCMVLWSLLRVVSSSLMRDLHSEMVERCSSSCCCREAITWDLFCDSAIAWSLAACKENTNIETRTNKHTSRHMYQ